MTASVWAVMGTEIPGTLTAGVMPSAATKAAKTAIRAMRGPVTSGGILSRWVRATLPQLVTPCNVEP